MNQLPHVIEMMTRHKWDYQTQFDQTTNPHFFTRNGVVCEIWIWEYPDTTNFIQAVLVKGQTELGVELREDIIK